MAKLSASHTPIKALVMGDSGVGKTGALWSLAEAGFKIKLYDADNGHGVLTAALRDSAAIDNVEVNVFTNKLKANPSGFIVPDGSPRAWPDFLKALNQWPDDPTTGAQTWGPDTVLVVDSLTKLGRHALLNAQHMEGKTGKQPEIQHYGTAMAQIEGTIATLYSNYVKCHVLVMTHIDYVKDGLGAASGLPMSLGEKLAAVIPTYFNTMVVVKDSGKKRILYTKPTAMVKTKVEAFDAVEDEYVLVEGKEPKPGLAEFFADCGWPGPEGGSK